LDNQFGEGYQLRYAQFCHKTDLLGPGQRFVIWVQGCQKRCENCVAKTMQPLDGGYLVNVKELAEEIVVNREITGITVSGGEPFLQADALYLLLATVKRIRPELDLVLYSGYTYEELKQSESQGVQALLGTIDVLIDGEYVDELNDDVPYRGSSNQRIHIFNNEEYYRSYYFSSTARKSKIQLQGNRLYLLGVPSKKTLQVWEKIKGENKNGY